MSLSQRSTERVSELCGVSVRATYPLSGGCIGEVYEVHLADKTRLVAKVGEGHSSSLSIEGRMLEYLGEHSTLPVPTVLHAADSLLLMDYIEGTSQFSAKAARHAAELLCELHLSLIHI